MIILKMVHLLRMNQIGMKMILTWFVYADVILTYSSASSSGGYLLWMWPKRLKLILFQFLLQQRTTVASPVKTGKTNVVFCKSLQCVPVFVYCFHSQCSLSDCTNIAAAIVHTGVLFTLVVCSVSLTGIPVVSWSELRSNGIHSTESWV